VQFPNTVDGSLRVAFGQGESRTGEEVGIDQERVLGRAAHGVANRESLVERPMSLGKASRRGKQFALRQQSFRKQGRLRV